MKHNWEYKRLGEVCSFIGGGTPSKSNQDYYCGNIPWATVRDMTNFELSNTEHSITEQAVRESATNIIPKNNIIISTHVGLGKICILKQDTAINQDLRGVIFSNSDVNKFFFAHWYRSIADYIIANGHGATVKGVTIDFIKKLQIPVPPMEEQERIVEELDEINELIALRKEQIADLDALAQSLFYDTFGDPISNPKGWEVKKFSNVIKLSSGNAISSKSILGGDYPVYGGNGIMGFHCEYNIDNQNIIIGRVGALCGNVRLVNGKAFVSDNAFIVSYNILFDTIFLSSLLSLIDLRSYAKAATQPVISNVSLKDINIIIPPLSLQQQFAEQVEAIEAHKAILNNTLTQLQTLLASRMDYWFN